LLDPPIVAVNVAFWSEVTTPPLAVNVAVVAPDATVTLAGTIRAAGALLASETLAPPLPAAFEIVTVQLAAPEDARLVLAHCSDVIVVDTVTDNPVETLDAPTVAVTVTLWSEVTAAAVAVNVAVVAPELTVTDAGTVTAAATLLDSETVVPALGAAAASVTVQVVAAEGARTLLAHCTPDRDVGPKIVNTWALLDAPSEAVNVAVRSDVTNPAFAVNVAVAAPEATVTDAGTIKMEGTLLDNVTLAPSAPAAFEIVTVHTVELAEARLALAHCSEVIVVPAAAVTVSAADALDPPAVAVTVTFWSDVTAPAVAVNVAVVAPAGTVTNAGTDNAVAALLASATLAPPLPAALEMVTVQPVVPEAGTVAPPHCREVIEMGAITITAVEAFHCPMDAVSITF